MIKAQKFYSAEITAPIKSRKMIINSLALEKALLQPLDCSYDNLKLTRIKSISDSDFDFIVLDPDFFPKIKDIQDESVTVEIHFIYSVYEGDESSFTICGIHEINLANHIHIDILENRIVKYTLATERNVYNCVDFKSFCKSLKKIQSEPEETVCIQLLDFSKDVDKTIRMIYQRSISNKNALCEFLKWSGAKNYE